MSDKHTQGTTSGEVVSGWYGPPNSRRWHYIDGGDGRSLCGKWLVPAWSEKLIDKAFGPAQGDCAACKRELEKRGYVTQEVADAIGEIGEIGSAP